MPPCYIYPRLVVDFPFPFSSPLRARSFTTRSLFIHTLSLAMWSVRDIVETTLAAAALVLGFCATPHALLQTWTFFRPNGETAKALRPTIIINATVARGSSPRPTARQVNKDWMQRLIARDLRRLVRQGRRRAEVDDRMVGLLETLVTKQSARAPRNFSAFATFNFD